MNRKDLDGTSPGRSSADSELSTLEVLAESDVRAIVRLLGETLAHPGSEVDRKRFLLEGLARLVGADVWAWATQKGGSSPNDIAYFTMMDGGWSSERQRGIATGAVWAGESQSIHDRMSEPVFTVGRTDVYSDVDWYATELFKKYREPAGLDDVLMTGFRLGPDLVSVIGLHRSLGRPPFSERERLIVNLVTTEVGWLHRSGIPEADLAPVDDMSPRQRHAMLLLVSGRSRKEIALEMGISVHTANEYIAQVYVRLGIHSRGELMARFLRGRGRTSDAKPPISGGSVE